MSSHDLFAYKGFEIPVDLVNMTGGGQDTWGDIAQGHMEQYQRYCPISPDHHILEIGCGVGRDAIELISMLGDEGAYLGIDIIEPSINWCQQNISPKFPTFQFLYFDIESQIHNPSGGLSVQEVSFPVPDNSIDRIILQSVFTHMFEGDIVHYLKEFRRVLKDDGLVCASFFIVDDETLASARQDTTGLGLTFQHERGEGCWVNDAQYPEGAVAYDRTAVDRMLAEAGLRLAQPVHRGHWSGLTTSLDGQDILVLQLQ
jgi:SAM-dependent methyltransferase